MNSESERLRPLSRNKDYTILWSSQALSALGGQVSLVSYPLVILAITHSAVGAGAVATVRTLVSYGAGFVGGSWVDRVDRRKVIVICEMARGIVAGIVVVLVVRHVTSLYTYLIVAAFGGAFGAPVPPALDAALVRVVPSRQFQQAMAQDQIRQQAASLLGPGLGGLLFGLAPWLPFSFDGATYLASVAGALAISADLRVRQSRRGVGFGLGELMAGIRWVAANSGIAQFCVTLGLVTLSGGGLYTLVIVLVRRSGASSFETGIALAIGAGAGVMGAALSFRLLKLLGELESVLLTLWTAALVIPCAALAPNFSGLATVLAVVSFVTPLAAVVVFSKLIPMVPDNLRGRVTASISVMMLGPSALGPVFAGGLIELLGSSAPALLAVPALLGAIGATSFPCIRSFIRTPMSALKYDE